MLSTTEEEPICKEQCQLCLFSSNFKAANAMTNFERCMNTTVTLNVGNCLSKKQNLLYLQWVVWRGLKPIKARIFLLIDLREFFFRFRVGGGAKTKIKKL